MQEPQPNMPPQPISKPKKATLGFAFSLAGAILILLRGAIRIALGTDILNFAGSDEIRRRILIGIALNVVGAVAVIFAVLILVGAFMLYKGMYTVGGVLVIIFSVLSIFAGSGWLIGLILGLVGGILGLLKK